MEPMNAMQRDAIENRLKKYKWYQRFPLGNGIYTPGVMKMTEVKLEMLRFPDDLSGKSVIDIGCNEGFFAFEAERRGASRVLAIDRNKRAHEKFQIAREILGSNVEFRNLDLFDLDEEAVGQFDISLFLAVLHRVKHPFSALDRIASVTSGVAIMEVPTAARANASGSSDEDPIMIRTIDKRGHYLLYPNLPFLLEMLERAGFARVEILGSHPRPAITGYGGNYFESRVILKAFKHA